MLLNEYQGTVWRPAVRWLASGVAHEGETYRFPYDVNDMQGEFLRPKARGEAAAFHLKLV